MDRLFLVLIPISLAAVVAVLFMGVYSLTRGGDYARRNSNRLMRWRVGLQAVAVLILVAAFIWAAQHPA
jgi:hypothetical protein